jgi:hypothetical protein
VPITVKETIVGCGVDWHVKEVIDRQNWLIENLQKDSYRAWYGGVNSDDRYIRFNNEEDALAYVIKWKIS